MISQLIDKAAEKIGGQNQLARKIGIPNGRMSDFKNYEESKRKPPDEIILALADILGLDKGETLYQAKLELEPKKARYWKFLVRSAGLEPTPQASEAYKFWSAVTLIILNIINGLKQIKILIIYKKFSPKNIYTINKLETKILIDFL